MLSNFSFLVYYDHSPNMLFPLLWLSYYLLLSPFYIIYFFTFIFPFPILKTYYFSQGSSKIYKSLYFHKIRIKSTYTSLFSHFTFETTLYILSLLLLSLSFSFGGKGSIYPPSYVIVMYIR